MPEPDCNSDHQLLEEIVKVQLKKISKPVSPLRLDYESVPEDYQNLVSNSSAAPLQCEEEKTSNKFWSKGKTSNKFWSKGKEIILDAAKKTIPQKKKKKFLWISDEAIEEIAIRREIKARGITTPVDKVWYHNQNLKVQKQLKKIKRSTSTTNARKLKTMPSPTPLKIFIKAWNNWPKNPNLWQTLLKTRMELCFVTENM